MRRSLTPTYDHRETGDRFTVETRINGARLNKITTRDPFVHHRLVIGWRDVLGFLFGGREVTIIVGGDPAIVDDVLELDADALTYNSTRRDEWNAHVSAALAAPSTEPDAAGRDLAAGKTQTLDEVLAELEADA